MKQKPVNQNLNTDKISEKKRNYHHGELKAALICAGESILSERGVEGFSLREAARRAGVSPGAPSHHFGDARGLLTAIATRAFKDLACKLIEAREISQQREECILAQCLAYVAFAQDNAARFDLMWRKAILDQSDPEFAHESLAAFWAIQETVEGAVDKEAPMHTQVSPATYAVWSLAHGFADLKRNDVIPEDADNLLKQILKTLSLKV
ncbi:TetR/AcrR family transcriptional regulator [Ahrensia sp. 13_GOM-1096m]|uniref:TetR/AcrR family transcriptional regulator n=1 Tax=Ahrensia sp. 13_GOM-1096m TaxID=1380380 RepID=UPI0006883B44|nr:TetR/AcrR family transcriptional regulator [Ahrensia sp. 13_GOM-1096m]